MIIFGTRGVTKTQQKGQFHCPECGPGQPFSHKAVRKFFTLYFIPVVPLDRLGDYIECQKCKGTYHLRVLDRKPDEATQDVEANFHTGARKVMIGMLLADGIIDDEEVKVIQKVYQDIIGHALEEAPLRAEIEEIQQSGAGTAQTLAEMRGYLNPEGIEMIVKAACRVAMADGEFHEDERALLWEMAQGLGMTPAHFKGLVNELLEG